MNARASAALALEALEVGDVAFAVAVLRDMLEELPPAEAPGYRVAAKSGRRYGCPRCPMAFEWPGLLSHHLQLGHGVDPG